MAQIKVNISAMKFGANRGEYYLFTRRATWFCYLFLLNRVTSPNLFFFINLKRDACAALRKNNWC